MGQQNGLYLLSSRVISRAKVKRKIRYSSSPVNSTAGYDRRTERRILILYNYTWVDYQVTVIRCLTAKSRSLKNDTREIRALEYEHRILTLLVLVTAAGILNQLRPLAGKIKNVGNSYGRRVRA